MLIIHLVLKENVKKTFAVKRCHSLVINHTEVIFSIKQAVGNRSNDARNYTA